MTLDEIKDALECESKEKNQPFPQGKDPLKWDEIKSSYKYKEMIEEVLLLRDKYLKEPIKTIAFSLYKLFDETGARNEYQDAYFDRRGRLNTFSILYLVYKKREYLEALEDIIWAICDEYTWCLPAHLGGKSLEIIDNKININNGKLSSKMREHKKEIDLFSAETGFALSEIVYLLEDSLSPIITYRVRKEITERILESYCELNSFFNWETSIHNWSAVCAGSIGATAIYLIDDNNVLAPIIKRVLESLKCFLNGYFDDGACMEGLGYWNYGFGFFVYFAEILKQRTSGKINLMQGEKVRQIALFQQKCYLSENKVVSFSDGHLSSNFRLGLTCYLKDNYKEIEIPDFRYRAKFADDHCFRWVQSIRDFVWSNLEYESSQISENTYYLKNSQWFISRKIDDKDLVAFAAKGGNNDEPHNHNDVGSFLLHKNGETLLIDLGCGEYTKKYFGSERYSYLCNNSGGHSIPIVENCLQKEGAQYYAEVIKANSSQEKDEFILDISGAYDNKNLQSLKREFVFTEGGLILEDSFIFENPPKAIIERFVSFIEPSLIEDGIVNIKSGKSSVEIQFDSSLLEYKATVENFADHFAVNRKVYLIDLEFKKEALIKETKAGIRFIFK